MFCSFGKMHQKEAREAATAEDKSRAVLVTITNNIAGIALLLAMREVKLNYYFVSIVF